MKAKLEERLRLLRKELQQGQRQLNVMEERYQDLTESLLRISGAIQVLEELLEQKDGNGEDFFLNPTSELQEEEQTATADN